MDILVLLIFTLVCAISDLRTHKIPNRLILCGLVWALMCRLFPASLPPPGLRVPESWLDAAAGFLIPVLLLGPLAALRMIGGGDVKLLAVIGLQLGAKNSIDILISSFLFAALWSVVLIIKRHNLIVRFQILYRYIVRVMAAGKLLPYRAGTPDPAGEFCFALPVLAALSCQILGIHFL